MTGIVNRTKIFDKEHTHFGGCIYSSDFSTSYGGKEHTNGSPIAARIEADFKRERETIKRTIYEKGAAQYA